MSTNEKPKTGAEIFGEQPDRLATIRDKVRGFFAGRGQSGLTEIIPMIGYKADYQDRLEKIRLRAAKRDEERGKTVRYDNARAHRRADERARRKEQRRGQRAYDRMQAAKAQREVTATNMARAVVGDFDHVSPHIRANVQVVVDREEAKQRG